jgi:hypothetical protein
LLEVCGEEQVGSISKDQALLTNLKIAGQNIRFISCQNSGESMTIKNDPEINHLALSLNFLVLELLKETERLKGNPKHFMEESGQYYMELVWKVIKFEMPI